MAELAADADWPVSEATKAKWFSVMEALLDDHRIVVCMPLDVDTPTKLRELADTLDTPEGRMSVGEVVALNEWSET